MISLFFSRTCGSKACCCCSSVCASVGPRTEDMRRYKSNTGLYESHAICIQMFEIHVAAVYFQAIVPALIIMRKENITQQPY